MRTNEGEILHYPREEIAIADALECNIKAGKGIYAAAPFGFDGLPLMGLARIPQAIPTLEPVNG